MGTATLFLYSSLFLTNQRRSFPLRRWQHRLEGARVVLVRSVVRGSRRIARLPSKGPYTHVYQTRFRNHWDLNDCFRDISRSARRSGMQLVWLAKEAPAIGPARDDALAGRS
jgi:hypothetical protein